MLEVCNCPGPMSGGLARRSGLFLSYRHAFKRVLTLDTGDVFWIEPNDMRNRFVLKGYEKMGYDVVALGDQEWALQDRLLNEYLSGDSVTYLSSGICGENPVPRLRKVVKKEWKDFRVAIVNHVGDGAFLFFDSNKKSGLKISPLGKLREIVSRLDDQGWFVVVVIHGTEHDLQEDMKRLGGDLFIQGHIRNSRNQIRWIGKKPVISVGSPDYVGAAAVDIDKNGELAGIDYRRELVDERWPSDSWMLELYQAYAHAAMREAIASERKKDLNYVPSSRCGQCHRPRYETWQKSAHARAWNSLQEAGRSIDPNCVMCHSLGFMKKGGFYTWEKTPTLAGVHCQSCHKFNADHKKTNFNPPRPGEKVCRTCHTPITDPHFDGAMKKRFETMGCGKSKH